MRLVTADPAAGLVDDLLLHVAPSTVGDGLRVFDGVADLAMVPVSSRTTPHVTHLTYRRPDRDRLDDRLALLARGLRGSLVPAVRAAATRPAPHRRLAGRDGAAPGHRPELVRRGRSRPARGAGGPGRGDAERVSATLIEADPRNAASASDHVSRAQLSGIEVRCTDAGTSDADRDAVPADPVPLCGIFGNVADDDVRRTIAATSRLCHRDAVVIWTRHRRDPDLTPRVRTWFDEHGFREEHCEAPAHAIWSVGVHRFVGVPSPLARGEHLFTFVR